MSYDLSSNRGHGTPASVLVTFAKLPSLGRTITVDGRSFVFGTDFVDGGHPWRVAESFATCVNSFVGDNQDPGSPDPGGSVHAIQEGDSVRIIANVVGTAGNSLAIAKDTEPGSVAEIVLSGATLSGGLEATLNAGPQGEPGPPGDPGPQGNTGPQGSYGCTELTYGPVVDLSFAVDGYHTLVLEGSVQFTSSGRSGGKALTVKVSGGGVARSLSFPAGWTWLHLGVPTELASGKVAILSATAFGTGESDVVAVWSVQP